jgi:hypothetical protein
VTYKDILGSASDAEISRALNQIVTRTPSYVDNGVGGPDYSPNVPEAPDSEEEEPQASDNSDDGEEGYAQVESTNAK